MTRPSLTLFALLLPLAACEPAGADADSLSGAELDEAVDEALDALDGDSLAEGGETVALSLDLDEELYPLDREARRAALREALRARAAEEPCTIRGIIAGRYGTADLDPDEDGVAEADGGFRLVAFAGREAPIALARGGYHTLDAEPGGVLAGRWVDRDDDFGTLDGSYDRVDRRRLGSLEAGWEQSNGTALGNLAGVWHGVRHREGGVFVGYWSACEA